MIEYICVSITHKSFNLVGKTIFRGNFSKDGKTSFGCYPSPKSERNDKGKKELKWIEFKEKENKEIWRRECKNVSKELNENDKFSLVINLRDGYYNVNYNGMDCDFKIYYQHWAIQYIVVFPEEFVPHCNVGKGNDRDSEECYLENCFIAADLVKANGSLGDAVIDNTLSTFGCGDCPTDKIPCRTCKVKAGTCNDVRFLNSAHYCWNISNQIEICDLAIYTDICYYVVDKEHTGFNELFY
uniref:Galectin n=1 Tax=Meloidogyne hapla TaxID=6305 RepID=A0A1I8BTI9_MELHA